MTIIDQRAQGQQSSQSSLGCRDERRQVGRKDFASVSALFRIDLTFMHRAQGQQSGHRITAFWGITAFET